MRILILCFMLLSSRYCEAQFDYRTTLFRKLAEIREESTYDNSSVVFKELSDYWSDFPSWEPSIDFFEDDIVLHKEQTYRAIRDSKGDKPSSSAGVWKLTDLSPPYRFLRDSAKTDDLRRLLASSHPYIRTYAFGALAYRKDRHLFPVLMEYLKDTVQFTQMTSDYGYSVCPADLAFEYIGPRLTRAQRDTVKHLILTRYTHLKTLEQVLLWYRSTQQEYPYVKKIAEHGDMHEFALIALARYRREEDVELIRTGLDEKNMGYYEGVKIVFMAFERFPHQSFREDLIRFSTKVDVIEHPDGYQYFFNALAAYHDEECLDLLDCYASQIIGSMPVTRFAKFRRQEDLGIIYHALKKHYAPMYDQLIARVRKNIESKYFLEHSHFPSYDDKVWGDGWGQ